MKLVKTLIASAALAASFGANALVVGSLGGPIGPILTLTAAGLSGGAVATFAGGSVLAASALPGSAMPPGTIGNYLSAGPTASEPATVTFTTVISAVSFLWGSPDVYNSLTVTDSSGGVTAFTAADFFTPANGNQGVAGYVEFAGVAGATITSLVFNNVPAIDAFETANYSVIAAPVPEPETYALMLAGLGAMGFVARRRRQS
jgi:hypothetical protein